MGEVSRKCVHSKKRGAKGRPGSTPLQDEGEPLALRLGGGGGQPGQRGHTLPAGKLPLGAQGGPLMTWSGAAGGQEAGARLQWRTK